MKSLGLNAVLNGFRTVVFLIFPLITFPYASTVLSVDNLGIYNFSDSVVSYFDMLAALGIYTYAVREGSKIRDNRKEFDAFVSQVFSINIISTLLAYCVLGICLLTVPKLQDYTSFILVFSIQLFFSTLGTEWIYSIFEEYAYITIRSIAFKIISMVLLFLLVKKPEDTIIYVGISVFANVGSNVLNIIYAKKFCSIRFTLHLDLSRHIKPILIIFSSDIAITIYTCSDSAMLGFLATDHEVGIYAVASKIYELAKSLLSSTLIVAVPRLSLYLGKNKKEEYRETLSQVLIGVTMFLLPTAAAIMILPEEFILLLSDSTYLEAANALRLLGVALIFCLPGWIASACVLIPGRCERIVLISTIVSAVLNIVLDFILIPYLQVLAVAISTIAAEASVMLINCLYSRKITSFSKNVPYDFFTILLGTACVIAACLWLKSLGFSYVKTLCCAVPASVITYFSLLFLLKNRLLIFLIAEGKKLIYKKKDIL